MRIVFVTSRFPYPVEKGDKLRAFHQIRELSRQHEVHLVAISHMRVSEQDLQAMEPYCKSVKVFYLHRWMLPFQIITGLLSGLPLQVSYFLDRTIKRKVQYHIIHIDPDHVICQLIRAASYVRALPFHKTLDYMDVFSEGMQQLANRYGWFGFPFRWEARRLAAFERTIYKDFDKHTIISFQDRARLSLATAEQVAVIPNGVDESFRQYEPHHPPGHELVFVGNLGYGPNISAVEVLVKKVLPELQKNGVVVKLLIAGARPGARIRRLHHQEHITIRGWVEDIREAYADGRIFVAPMYSGLGLQNKILEAMAMGLPCVTTSLVNNAIGATPDKEIVIGDSIEAIVIGIHRLLRDPEYYQNISLAAKAFVRDQYTWENQVRKLEHFIQSENLYTTR